MLCVKSKYLVHLLIVVVDLDLLSVLSYIFTVITKYFSGIYSFTHTPEAFDRVFADLSSIDNEEQD